MKYITQIILDKGVAAKRKLYGLYEWHQEVWKLFPGRERDKRNLDFYFLTRLDEEEQEFRFTVISDIKPQKPDWYPEGCYREKEIPVSFFERRQYLFQLKVNPTRTLSHRSSSGQKKKNGSHYAITNVDELKKWFLKKAEENGFRVLDEPDLEIAKPVFYRLHKKDREGTIAGVEFKGALEVVNRENFVKTVREGIGRARGFGFGMLGLKPIA